MRGQYAGRACILLVSLLTLSGSLFASGIPRTMAQEVPTIFATNSGMSNNDGVCRLWNEYRYTASKEWIEDFKRIASSAQLGEIISESPEGELTSLIFRKTITGEGLCAKTSQSVWTYTKTGIASFTANFTYIGVLAGVSITAALNGYRPDNPKVTAVAGCLAGAISNAVSNAILGLTDWRQLLAGAITSCAVDSPGYAISSKIFVYAQRLANSHSTAPAGASPVEAATRSQVEDEAAIDIGQLGG